MDRRVGIAVIALVVLAGCGQKPPLEAALQLGSAGGAGHLLPPECEGDAEHCVVLTTFQGVNVYRNHGPGGFCSGAECRYPMNRYGTRWQCVELFNRFFALRYGTRHVPGHARDLFVNALHVDGLEVVANGGRRPPVVGDAIVLAQGRYGHVAIVAGVSAAEIMVVEQNIPGDGTHRLPFDPSTNRVGDDERSAGTVVGWIHATANRPRVPAGTAGTA